MDVTVSMRETSVQIRCGPIWAEGRVDDSLLESASSQETCSFSDPISTGFLADSALFYFDFALIHRSPYDAVSAGFFR